MDDRRDMVCIVCPKGCPAQAWEEGGTVHVEGKLCKKGKPYIQQEYQDPRRVLTTTVMTKGGRFKRLPVRTSVPIPRRDLFEAMAVLSHTRVTPPVKIGEVILAGISSGVDVIASDDLLE